MTCVGANVTEINLFDESVVTLNGTLPTEVRPLVSVLVFQSVGVLINGYARPIAFREVQASSRLMRCR